jgi:hypothetical protein
MGLVDKVTILDEYDCVVMSDRIRISIDSTRDPSLVDIMSELHESNGNIYFDGAYYMFSGDYDIQNIDGCYLDLYLN